MLVLQMAETNIGHIRSLPVLATKLPVQRMFGDTF